MALLSDSPVVLPIHRKILAFSFIGWIFDFYDLLLLSFLVSSTSIVKDLSLSTDQVALLLGTALAFTAVGGFIGGNGGGSVQKNHPTVAQISGGALVEREIPTEIVRNNYVELLLREPDFTSAARLATAVNLVFTNSAEAIDSTSVRVRVPEGHEKSPVQFISLVEAIEVQPDVPARIIVNERTGTIVATSRIRIAPCAVSHGELTISIANTDEVSQPGAFSQTGSTAVTTRTDASVAETKARFVVLREMPTIEKVAAGLNAIGVTPRDMMAIFQAMKQAGALQAELIMR